VIFPESPPPGVLAAYDLPGAVWTPLGSAGGFSGSKIWRGATADGRALCLKAHPRGRKSPETYVHQWMSAVALPFVPKIERTALGRTAVEHQGRVWELTQWMPGRADFHTAPTDARLSAAVVALAQLHTTWSADSGAPTVAAGVPAVDRRLAALTAWRTLIASGWRPAFGPADGRLRAPAEAAWNVLPAHVSRAIRDLEPWRPVAVRTHPCLCDVWHDHVLFEGDRVTGIIDFAAAKRDHPAVDLARLLGSLIPDDPDRTAFALDVYQRIAPLSHPQLVALLDRTGTVVAATHWLRAIYLDGRPDLDPTAVSRRLDAIVQRLVRWG
jgi:Ser/Thr protein kinase RdoA (MazF antagonist)